MKILIADDEVDVLEIMAKKVKEEGHEVVTARDGQEALDKIAGNSPDIILLDLTMPKVDGLTVLQKVRENPHAEKWQPVIIISARDELEDMRKGFSLDADHYITKPCNMEDVLKGIRLMVNLIPQRKSSKEMDGEGS